MVTTRSQDRKLEESELPVRPRAIDLLSSQTPKRPRTPAEHEKSVKRARTDLDIPTRLHDAAKYPAALSDDFSPCDLASQTVPSQDPPQVPSEASSDPDPRSEQQRPHDALQPSELVRAQENAPVERHLASDMNASTPETNPEFTAQTQPSRMHMLLGSTQLDHNSAFEPPRTSRANTDTKSMSVVDLGTMKLSPTTTDFPHRTHLQQVPMEVSGTMLRRRPRTPTGSTLGQMKLELDLHRSPTRSSSSLARYQHSILGRHKRTAIWGGRKPNFITVRAR